MDPLTASLAFSTIVQLICNFKQERDSQESEGIDEFHKWLIYHKFESISQHIQASSDIQLEVQNVLKGDTEEINRKLDIISSSIHSISSKLEGLSGLARVFDSSDEGLSDQAVAILKKFADSQSNKLGVFLEFNPPNCVLVPENKSFGVTEGRFLATDIETLESYGFLQLENYNQSGAPFYTLTRSGYRFAQSSTQNLSALSSQ